MNGVYKVTSATVATTKNRYKIFKLHLNNTIWASKLFPLRHRDKKYNTLYNMYKDNNGSLDLLVGKYIDISLETSNYGINFTDIKSYDVIKDFEELLNKSDSEAFFTIISIYDFLKQRNYKINTDSSITLNPPYSHLNIIKKGMSTVCYPNRLEAGVLTIDNIESIYNEFFHGKKIETGNLDKECEYKLTHVEILKYCQKYHKTKGGIDSTSDQVILKVGDSLDKDMLNFIAKNK